MKKLMLKKFESLPQGETVVEGVAHWFLRPLELWPQALAPSPHKEGRLFRLLSYDSWTLLFALPLFFLLLQFMFRSGVFTAVPSGVSTFAISSIQCCLMNGSELNAWKGSSGRVVRWLRTLNSFPSTEERTSHPGILSSGKELVVQPDRGRSPDVLLHGVLAALCALSRGGLCSSRLPKFTLEFVLLHGRDFTTCFCVKSMDLYCIMTKKSMQ